MNLMLESANLKKSIFIAGFTLEMKLRNGNSKTED